MAQLRGQAFWAFQPCPPSSTSPPRRGQLSTAVRASVGRLVCNHMGGGAISPDEEDLTPRRRP